MFLKRVFWFNAHLFPQLSTNVAQPLNAVEAHRFQSTVAKHFRNLRVLLLILLEYQLALLRLVLVLSTTTILSSFSFIFRHCFGVCFCWFVSLPYLYTLTVDLSNNNINLIFIQ